MKKINLSDNSQVALVELTRTGLCVELMDQICFFCDNVGNFRRYATTEEVDSIRFNLSPITFQGAALCPMVELPYQIPAGAIRICNTGLIGEPGQYQISEDIVTLCLERHEDCDDAYCVWADYDYSPEICDQAEALGFHLVG